MRRRAGSVRFDPYYKAQVWRDDVGGAWVDIQRAYPTEELAIREARLAAHGRRWRIMRVYPGGREPVVEGLGAEISRPSLPDYARKEEAR